MLTFKNVNVNPKGRKTTDCVLRAMTTATNRAYEDVFKEMFELSLKTGYFINDKKLEEKFLEKNGYIKAKQPRKADGTKYKIGELDKILSIKDMEKGVIVRCAHHLTVIKGNCVVDTWDCRNKSVGNYYIRRF